MLEKWLPRLRSAYPVLFVVAFFAVLIAPLRYQKFSPGDLDGGFFGRAQLILRYNDFRLWFGDSVFPKALVGKDGWLFYNAEHSVELYQNARPFSEKELAQFQKNVDAVDAGYRQRGVTLLIVIEPDKATIYPDYMPTQVQKVGEKSRLDQVMEYMSAHGKARILDLRPALLQARTERQIYYATDTHWNDYGAYVGYSEILKVLQAEYPALRPLPLAGFKYEALGRQQLDLARTIGASRVSEEKFNLVAPFDYPIRVRSLALEDGRKVTLTFAEHPGLPKAVIFHDSFFFQVMPMIDGHFSQAIFIPHYSGAGIWDLGWVQEEKPDIVIVEFAERYLHDVPRFVKPED
jgi:hypothetical protein